MMIVESILTVLRMHTAAHIICGARCVQAMDRAHRIGQKKPVQVFRFCTEHAIEEKVRTSCMPMNLRLSHC